MINKKQNVSNRIINPVVVHIRERNFGEFRLDECCKSSRGFDVLKEGLIND